MWANENVPPRLYRYSVLAQLSAFSPRCGTRDALPSLSPPSKTRQSAYAKVSLGSLLLFVALCAIACSWLGWQASIVAERRAVKAMLDERNVGMNGLPLFTPNSPKLPWYRCLMGDDTCGGIYLNASRFSNKEICRILNAYPEIDFAILNEDYLVGQRHLRR